MDKSNFEAFVKKMEIETLRSDISRRMWNSVSKLAGPDQDKLFAFQRFTMMLAKFLIQHRKANRSKFKPLQAPAVDPKKEKVIKSRR